MEVEAVVSPYAGEGANVPRCTLCGAVIDVGVSSSIGEGCEFDPSISLDEQSLIDESVSIPTLNEIVLVGFAPSIHQLLEDKVHEKNLAREVISCTNGEEMIVNVIDRLKGDSGNGDIDLVLTEVPMPFLNGINAAIGLRAIEKTYPEHDLIPILFLTNKPCDETFKRVIKYLSPAKYATLGPVDDKERLTEHLTRIISLVSKERW